MLISYREGFLFVAWAVIFVRLHANLVLRRYFPFALYTAVSALALIGRIAAEYFWGWRSDQYAALYFVTDAAYGLAAVGMLLWLHYIPARPSLRRDWPIAAFALLAAVLELYASPGSHPLLRFARAVVFFRSLLGFKVLLRCLGGGSFRMGRNLGAALLCELVPTTLQMINYTLYLSGLWSYGPFADFIALVHILSWGVAAWGMWELDPPEKTE